MSWDFKSGLRLLGFYRIYLRLPRKKKKEIKSRITRHLEKDIPAEVWWDEVAPMIDPLSYNQLGIARKCIDPWHRQFDREEYK